MSFSKRFKVRNAFSLYKPNNLLYCKFVFAVDILVFHQDQGFLDWLFSLDKFIFYVWLLVMKYIVNSISQTVEKCHFSKNCSKCLNSYTFILLEVILYIKDIFNTHLTLTVYQYIMPRIGQTQFNYLAASSIFWKIFKVCRTSLDIMH